MATTYLTPGVYIEEIDRGPKPIQGVGTNVTAFIGFTQKAEEADPDHLYFTKSILGKAQMLTNWSQYESSFGGLDDGAYLPYAVRGFFENGGVRCYVISIRSLRPMPGQLLIHAPDVTKLDGRVGQGQPSLLIHTKATVPAGAVVKVGIEWNKKGQQGGGNGGNGTPSSGSPNGGSAGSASPTSTTTTSGTTDTTTVVNPTAGGDEAQAKRSKSLINELNAQKSGDSTTENHATSSGNGGNSSGNNGGKGTPSDVPPNGGRAESTASSGNGGNGNNGGHNGKGNGNNGDQPDFWLTVDYTINGGDAIPSEKVGVKFDDLLPYGESQRGLPKVKFENVKVWRLNKAGSSGPPLAERLPKPGADYLLTTGAPVLDLELLGGVDKTELLTKAGDVTANAIFKKNSIALFEGSEPTRKSIGALEALDDVSLICAPDLMKAYQDEIIDQDGLIALQKTLLSHCERTHYRFAILDAPPDKKKPKDIYDWRMKEANLDSMHGALYYPWIKIQDPVTNKPKFIPPSGHMAGIYARSDSTRGVHKAPANEQVRFCIDVETNVTSGEQDLLNPVGINCIRSFSGRGVRVWGARTLTSDPAWRYINVRRLFNYVEQSVEESTQWIVFEPNDQFLWARVRRDITAFLRTVWLSGALLGGSPQEAFYVKCDEETNPRELIDLGQMICEIGMAPVKPAEFVIFRFTQWAGPGTDA